MNKDKIHNDLLHNQNSKDSNNESFMRDETNFALNLKASSKPKEFKQRDMTFNPKTSLMKNFIQ